MIVAVTVEQAALLEWLDKHDPGALKGLTDQQFNRASVIGATSGGSTVTLQVEV